MEKQIYGLIQHNIKDVRLNITDHVFDHIDGLLMIISWYLEDEIKDIVCLGFDGDLGSKQMKISDLCYDIKYKNMTLRINMCIGICKC